MGLLRERRYPARRRGCSSMAPLLISLISACAALVVSLAWSMDHFQDREAPLQHEIPSTNRQKWIEALRDFLAHLAPSHLRAAVASLQVRPYQPPQTDFRCVKECRDLGYEDKFCLTRCSH